MSLKHASGNWLHNATIANIKANVAKLKADPIIGKTEVVGALYDLASGTVSLV